MGHRASAKDVERIRAKYSRISDTELLQVDPENIIPEAQTLLAAEFQKRGWDEKGISTSREELKQNPVPIAPTTSSALPFLGKVFLWLGGGTLLYALHLLWDGSGAPSEPSWALYLLLALILIILGGLIAGSHRKVVFDERTEFANYLARSLAAGRTVGPFSLYLRPFNTTGLLQVRNRNPLTSPATPSSLYIPKIFELEACMADALRRSAPLAALGRPGEHLGAGRIVADESKWQEMLKALAAAARLIYVVPSDRPGTRWEIDWIKTQQYFGKTIFVMPLAIDTDKPRLDAAGRWEVAGNSLRELGLMLPDYTKHGMLFVLGARGDVSKSVQLGRYDPDLFLQQTQILIASPSVI